MRGAIAAVAGGILIAGCGSSGARQGAPAGGNQGVFVVCTGSAAGTPTYAIVETPGSGCRALVVGKDYADGRVIIGLQPGTTDEQLSPALVDYRATVIASHPELGDRVLQVPNGSVPQAVVGLARYPFIAFAQPDMIAHTNQATRSGARLVPAAN
jgi:hypothetical protein